MYALPVSGHRTTAVILAVLLAIGAGGAVGAVAQMAAVDPGDPRTGVIPSLPATPSPSPTPTPTPTPSPAPTPSPEQAEPDVWLYTVAEGDSLSGLAIRFGTTTEELLILNPEYAANEDLVEVGSQVIMPCTPLSRTEDRC